MDWNDMRDELRKIKAPQIRPGAPGPVGGSVDDLIERLKKHEAGEQAKLKQSRFLFLVATGFMGFAFVGISLSQSGPLHVHRTLHQGVLFAAFVYITVGLKKKLWDLSKVDYTRPASSFLEEAERRYVFMRPRDYVIMICGLLLLGVGSAPYVLGVFLSRYVDRSHDHAAVVLYCLFYLLLCAMGFYFTWRNWRRDKASLLADIHTMRDALEGEKPSGA
jgi:hypothetical protein